MVIVDSDGGDADVAGTNGGVPRVVGGVEDATLGMVTVKGAAWAGGMISVGISACCGYSSCGISGYAGLVGAPGCAT